MELNISELLKEKKVEKKLNLIIQEDGLYDGIEYIKLLQPISFIGTLSKVEDDFTLKGKLQGVLELTCSRCIEKFPYAIDIAIVEKFTNIDKVDRDDEIIFINSDVIDITQVIQNNIILTLPIKRLCKENCKGLCQQCGTNLNKFECQCKSHDIDLRLAKLKDMFFTD
ncbi:YceD family protein [Clostridium sp. WILCCON 0269]|uniref:YceD family protein n=1 Tax=Candidatus Clostridium eludens TaxID=3381663 RepID=A0ABW8SMD9_9CLOT